MLGAVLAVALGLPAPGAGGISAQGAPEAGGEVGVVRLGIGGGGPFGGGGRSAALELGAARRAGLDVLFRDSRAALVDGTRAATRFSLDGPSEPIDAGEGWTAAADQRGLAKRVELEHPPRAKGRARRAGADRGEEHAFDAQDSRDGSASLRLALRGSDSEGFEGFAVQVGADGGLHRHPLSCELRARLWVLVLAASADGRPFAEFGLSEQPFGDGRAAGPDVLHYYLSNAGEPVEVVGRTVFLPVPYEPGAWNELTLELSADARTHAAAGLDNALGLVRLGVESRFQAPAAARFDELRLERGLTGPEALVREREVFRELEAAFGLRLLPGIAGPAPGGERLELGAAAVPWQAADDPARGLAVLARPSPAGPESAAGEGCGLILVGGAAPDLPDALAAWEQLLQAGRLPVALGAGGELGEPRGPRIHGVRSLASFVLAPAGDEAALLAALAAGRLAVGDPGAFHGGLDLESERGFRMGQVVLTDRERAAVRLVRHGVPAAEERYAWHTPQGTVEDGGEGRVELAELPAFARAVVLGTRAEPVAFSNALHFVRAFPPGGIPPERAAFDVAGARCRSVRGLSLEGVRADADGLGISIEARAIARAIEGAGGGALALELPGDRPVELAWEGLRGESQQRGSELYLEAVEGQGRVGLRWGR